MAGVGIGLIGCGRLAQAVYFGALAGLPGARVVAVADPDARARGRAAAHFGAAAFPDAGGLLAAPGVDAVLLALPTLHHAEVACAAFEAGKHVYVEKPLACDGADAARVVEAWRASGRVGMVGFNFRHDPGYRELRRRIRAGEIGAAVAVRSVFTAGAAGLPAWKRARASGGGALLDLASHHVDLVRFLFDDEVARVACSLRSRRSEDDTALLELWLRAGIPVQSLVSLCSAEEDRIEVYGEAGRLALDRYRGAGVERLGSGFDYGRPARLRRLLARTGRELRALARGGGEPSFRAALASFIAAVRGAGAATPDLEDGLRALEVVLAAERAAELGAPVEPRAAGASRGAA